MGDFLECCSNYENKMEKTNPFNDDGHIKEENTNIINIKTNDIVDSSPQLKSLP